MRRHFLLALALAPLAGACSGGGDADPQAALAQRGKVVFETNCIACHSPDPTRDGPVGPANACASLALLTAKVLRNEYPPGYAPKRDTRAMVPLPHLEKELPALAAYLGSLGCAK
jgi:mono/diheme cytochrome c family protein